MATSHPAPVVFGWSIQTRREHTSACTFDQTGAGNGAMKLFGRVDATRQPELRCSFLLTHIASSSFHLPPISYAHSTCIGQTEESVETSTAKAQESLIDVSWTFPTFHVDSEVKSPPTHTDTLENFTHITCGPGSMAYGNTSNSIKTQSCV